MTRFHFLFAALQLAIARIILLSPWKRRSSSKFHTIAMASRRGRRRRCDSLRFLLSIDYIITTSPPPKESTTTAAVQKRIFLHDSMVDKTEREKDSAAQLRIV
jgi:hypothetical protein